MNTKKLIILTLAIIAAAAVQAFALTAKIETTVGVVKILKSGQSQWIPARINMQLAASDKIRTELGSEARILFSNGSSVKVDENTVISLNALTSDDGSGNTQVKVWNGGVFAKVQKLGKSGSQFQFETPTIIAGVRGTRAGIESRNGVGTVSSDPENEPGSLEVYPPGKKNDQIILEPGMAATGSSDGKITTAKITKEQQRNLEVTAKEEKMLTDGQPPKLEINNYQPAGEIEGPKLKIEGKSAPNVEIKLLIDGKELESIILEKETFSLELEHGKKIGEEMKLEIAAVDQVGRSTRLTGQLKVKEKPIELKIETPRADDIDLIEDTIEIAGTTAPGLSVKVLLQEKELSAGESDKEGKFKYSIDLKEMKKAALEAGDDKPQVLVIAVTQGSVRKEVKKNLIFRKPKVPFQLESPKGDVTISLPELEVAGKTKSGAKISIALNDKPVESLEADKDGNFKAVLNFTEYLNAKAVKTTFTFEADGETEKITRQIEYKIEIAIRKFEITTASKTAPYYTIGEIEIQGEFSPPEAEFSVNGQAVSADKGKFTLKLALADGEQNIKGELKLKETILKTEQKIIIDTKPPVIGDIVINDPLAKAMGAPEGVILSSFVNVRVSVSGAARVQINSRDAFPSGNDAFEGQLLCFRNGEIPVNVKAVDIAGNEITAPEKKVKYDGEANTLDVYPPVKLPKLYGRTKPESKLFVAINDNDYINGDDVSTGIFQLDLSSELFSLAEGSQVKIVIKAKDKYGRETPPWIYRETFDMTEPKLISIEQNNIGDKVQLRFDVSEPVVAILVTRTGISIAVTKTDSMGSGVFEKPRSAFLQYQNASGSVPLRLILEDRAKNTARINLDDYIRFDLPPAPPRKYW